jgi:hypothetical protein
MVRSDKPPRLGGERVNVASVQTETAGDRGTADTPKGFDRSS